MSKFYYYNGSYHGGEYPEMSLEEAIQVQRMMAADAEAELARAEQALAEAQAQAAKKPVQLACDDDNPEGEAERAEYQHWRETEGIDDDMTDDNAAYERFVAEYGDQGDDADFIDAVQAVAKALAEAPAPAPAPALMAADLARVIAQAEAFQAEQAYEGEQDHASQLAWLMKQLKQLIS